MRGCLLRAFLGLALTITSGVALAQTGNNPASGQTNPPVLRPPVFPRLFPMPTHNNGYEEWVLAVDLIQNNDEIDKATQPGATLTFKRRVLANHEVQQALALLR